MDRTSFPVPHAESWSGHEAKANKYLLAKKCSGRSMSYFVFAINIAAKVTYCSMCTEILKIKSTQAQICCHGGDRKITGYLAPAVSG